MYFKDIMHKIVDKRTKRKIENVDWEEYADIFILHLNTQAQQYGGFTPARRVSDRTPELPIANVGIPRFRYFTNPGDPPLAQNARSYRNLEKYKEPF